MRHPSPPSSTAWKCCCETLVESTPDELLESVERWDVEASYYSRWLELLPELKIRVDEAIDRYERIRTMASTGS